MRGVLNYTWSLRRLLGDTLTGTGEARRCCGQHIHQGRKVVTNTAYRQRQRASRAFSTCIPVWQILKVQLLAEKIENTFQNPKCETLHNYLGLAKPLP